MNIIVYYNCLCSLVFLHFHHVQAAHASVSARRQGPGCLRKCQRSASTRTKLTATRTAMWIRCWHKSNNSSNDSYLKTHLTEWRDLQETSATRSTSRSWLSTSRKEACLRHRERPPILSALMTAPPNRKLKTTVTHRTKPTYKTSSASQQSLSRKVSQRGSPRFSKRSSQTPSCGRRTTAISNQWTSTRSINSSRPSQRRRRDQRPQTSGGSLSTSRDNFRLEGDSCNQRQENGSTCWKITGVHSAGTQQPPRGRYLRQHIMGGATNMGNRNKHCPLQDCIKVYIQSQPRRGFHPQGPPNTHHSRRATRSQKCKGLQENWRTWSVRGWRGCNS